MARKTQKSLLNFNSGIWSSKLDGRIDLERYSYACRQLENFLIRPYGMIERRPGTKYIAHTKDNGSAIVEGFQYSNNVSYIMEYGDSYVRFYENQAQVKSSLNITVATYSGGTATYTAAGHNIAVDDVVTVTGITPTAYNIANARVTAVTATTFDLEIPTDPGGAGSVFGSVAQPLELVTPYASADLKDLQFRQINDVVYITHQDYEPYILRRLSVTPTFDIAPVVFDLPPFRDENTSAITLDPSAPAASDYVPGEIVTMVASAPQWVTATFYKVGEYVRDAAASPYEIYICREAHTSGTFATDLTAAKWEQIVVFRDDNPETNVGGYYRLGHKRTASSITLSLGDAPPLLTNNNATSASPIRVQGRWNFRTTGRWDGTVQVQRRNPYRDTVWEVIREATVVDGGRNIDFFGDEDEAADLRINFTAGANITNAGFEVPTAYLEADEAYVYGYAKVTSVTDNITADMEIIDPFIDDSATDVWAESSWSPRRGYPRTCDLHEQRIVYAGNIDEPLKIWGSRLGDFQNFIWGIKDDDAFSYAIPSTEQNPIQWIIGGKSILIGNGKEYGVLSSGSDDLPITPTNAVYRIQEAIGFSQVKPQIIGPIFAGVERNGQRLREIAYDFTQGVSGGYKANDLNRLNNEISDDYGFIDIAFSQLREPYIYAVTATGGIGLLSYNRDDNVIGWSKITTGDPQFANYFQSVAVLRGSDNDEVYVSTTRSLAGGGNKHYIELFKPETWNLNDNPRDAYFVDCGIETTTFLNTLSATWASEVATYTTDGDHGLQVGDKVNITNAFPDGWNVSVATITAVPASDQLSITLSNPGSSPGSTANILSNRVSGLGHLAGATVQVLGEGSPQGEKVVDADGYILMDNPANKIKVGLPYTTIYEPMRLDIDSIAGSSQGHKKIISEINLRVHESVGCSINNGITEDIFPFNDTDDLMDVAVPLFTGEKRINWDSTLGTNPDLNDPKLIISQTQPLPLSIISVIVKYKIF